MKVWQALTRRLLHQDFGPVEIGIRRCRDCGRPHNCYQQSDGSMSWADPVDGHGYFPESWESIARRLLAEKQRAACCDCDCCGERAS